MYNLFGLCLFFSSCVSYYCFYDTRRHYGDDGVHYSPDNTIDVYDSSRLRNQRLKQPTTHSSLSLTASHLRRTTRLSHFYITAPLFVMAERVLMNEYKALDKETWTNVSLVNDNIFEWNVALIVLNPDSAYYGG